MAEDITEVRDALWDAYRADPETINAQRKFTAREEEMNPLRQVVIELGNLSMDMALEPEKLSFAADTLSQITTILRDWYNEEHTRAKIKFQNDTHQSLFTLTNGLRALDSQPVEKGE